MVKRKILIFSSGGMEKLVESFKFSFESLGHSAEIYFQDFRNSNLYLSKFFFRTPFTHLHLKYWEKYKEANGVQYDKKIQSFHPDLILMFNFNSISAKLFRKIIEYYKIPTAYIVFADPLITGKADPYFLENLIYCSHLFFINHSAIPSLKLFSDASMNFLPLSVDLRFFKPLSLKKDLDLVLVGQFSALSVATITKAYILDRLCGTGFNVSAAGLGLKNFVGLPHFSHLKKLNIITSLALSTEEVNVLYNRAKIVLAPEHPRDKDSPSPRAFEAAAAGAFALADYQTDAEALFHGSLITFRSVNELIDKADYYLRHDQEREELAGRAHAIVKQEHTYQKRAETILRTVFP